ncbi:MAG TPA: hypothetical protein VIN62_00280, partial [Candidatus Cryosericum sp.]
FPGTLLIRPEQEMNRARGLKIEGIKRSPGGSEGKDGGDSRSLVIDCPSAIEAPVVDSCCKRRSGPAVTGRDDIEVGEDGIPSSQGTAIPDTSNHTLYILTGKPHPVRNLHEMAQRIRYSLAERSFGGGARGIPDGRNSEHCGDRGHHSVLVVGQVPIHDIMSAHGRTVHA